MKFIDSMSKDSPWKFHRHLAQKTWAWKLSALNDIKIVEMKLFTTTAATELYNWNHQSVYGHAINHLIFFPYKTWFHLHKVNSQISWHCSSHSLRLTQKVPTNDGCMMQFDYWQNSWIKCDFCKGTTNNYFASCYSMAMTVKCFRVKCFLVQLSDSF